MKKNRLESLNQKLLEQIKQLRIGEHENPDIKHTEKIEIEEVSCIKNHNQNLLTQIKKLKSDTKSLENKLEEFSRKEASISLEIAIQFEEKGTNTDLDNIMNQNDPNPIEVNIYIEVSIQMIETLSKDPVINQFRT